MNILSIAILTCFMVINVSCQPKATVKPAETIVIEIGSVTGNIYTNKALGFRIMFPETMVVDTREELDHGLNEGVELMKQGESVHGKAIQQMEREERIVFGLNTPESEAAGAMNISVIKGSGVGPFKDMVARTLQVFVDSTKSKIVKPIGNETISGQSLRLS